MQGPHKYPENYKKLPQQIILGSETASTVSSRGVYKFPVVRQAMKKYDDHQSSSYDVEILIQLCIILQFNPSINLNIVIIDEMATSCS